MQSQHTDAESQGGYPACKKGEEGKKNNELSFDHYTTTSLIRGDVTMCRLVDVG